MNASDWILLAFFLLPVLFGVAFLPAFRRYRTTRSNSMLLLGNLLLSLALLSAVLPVGETYFRFFQDETDGYALSLSSRRWMRRHYVTNDAGVRDDVDYVGEAAPGKLRVLVAGDSFANGHGVPDVRDRFTNRLRREHPEWDVRLLARNGLDTGPLIEGVHERLRKGERFDLLLYSYCLNDISDMIPRWRKVAARVYGERLPFFIAHSYLLNTYYYRYRILFDDELSRYGDWIAEAYETPETWVAQRNRLRDLDALVEANGGKLAVVTFPFFENISDERYRAIHRRLGEFWEGVSVPHLDLIDVYSTGPTERYIVNKYDTHPNELAHEIAAIEIGRFIRSVESISEDGVDQRRRARPAEDNRQAE